MEKLISNLGRSARVISLAALTGIIAMGPALALDCSNALNATAWPQKFNNGIYDCDDSEGNYDEENCQLLTDVQGLCCFDPSDTAWEEECMCNFYHGKEALFNPINIDPPACDAYLE